MRHPDRSNRINADVTDNPQLPIDPYTSSYWESATSKSSLQASTNPQGTLMEPPRIPLKLINRQNAKLSSPSKDAKKDSTGKMKPPKGPKRFLPPEVMNEFKNAVQGNYMTKIGILEILKKQYGTFAPSRSWHLSDLQLGSPHSQRMR